MITWAAILLLRGVEDGMTHQDGIDLREQLSKHHVDMFSDLHLIQAHLHSLERSHYSTASIHRVLSQRLESSMQAMNTPPDTSSALAFPVPNTDDPWTIFDQDIMSLANPPWLFEDPAPFPPPQKSTDQDQQIQSAPPPGPYDPGLLDDRTQSFASNAQWDNAAMHGAMPTPLSRIFGTENATQGGGII